MSIYIKGMKKPKNCDECPIKAWEDEWYVCPFSGVTTLSIGCQDNCPLVEIPPHGRLIDADALTGCLATLLQFPSNLVNGQWIVNTIREQPTIIPEDKDAPDGD